MKKNKLFEKFIQHHVINWNDFLKLNGVLLVRAYSISRGILMEDQIAYLKDVIIDRAEENFYEIFHTKRL